MNLGYKLKESRGKLEISFKKKPVVWDRFASKLIKDKVILDIKNAKKAVEKGDLVVYKVFNLWKFIEKFKKITEETRIACDLTLLNNGILSPSYKGELFLTYGHAHEKYYGEAYTVLKNECFILLTDRKNYNSFIIYLKKGDSILIHPKYLHRLISFKKGSLVVGFVPKEAGHDYEIIKNKGFPFHIFYDSKKKKIEFMRNRRYRKSKIRFIGRHKSKIDPIKLFEKNPKKLKDILENPERYEKIYFIKSIS